MADAPFDWSHAVLALFVVVGVPAWDRYETRRLRANPTTAARIRLYRITVAMLWALALYLLATAGWPLLDRPPSLVGVSFGASRGLALPVLVGLTVGVGLPVVLARRSSEARERLAAPLRAVDFFLPKTRAERWWWVAVSVSAGVCEEIVYRGFLIRWIDGALGHPHWAAPVLLSAVAFGLAHGYQGWRGMLVTGVLAVALWGLLVVVGALWPVMLVHALLDLRVLALLPPDDTAPNVPTSDAEAPAP